MFLRTSSHSIPYTAKKMRAEALINCFAPADIPTYDALRRKGDSNPRYPYEYDSLANCWFQPLTHLSFVGTDFAINKSPCDLDASPVPPLRLRKFALS